MENLLLWSARIAGCVGILICVAAFAARVTGTWTLAGVPIGTVLHAGMAAMLLGCLAYSASVAERARQ